MKSLNFWIDAGSVHRRHARLLGGLLILSVALALGACGGSNRRPPATTQPPTTPAPSPPAPQEQEDTFGDASAGGDLVPIDESDDILSMSLEDINAQSPLADIQFAYDSADLSSEARAGLEANVRWLRRNPSVTILIEGHCDERGTVEYNLALGEKRAMAAYNFIASSGIPSERMKTISYGKEFPLDPGHHEAAWAKNRRAHFVITSK